MYILVSDDTNYVWYNRYVRQLVDSGAWMINRFEHSYIYFIASFFSNSLTMIQQQGQPFDTIKVRLQVSSAEYNNSALKCLQRTVSNEGR